MVSAVTYEQCRTLSCSQTSQKSSKKLSEVQNDTHFSITPREKCPNTKLFLVRIFNKSHKNTVWQLLPDYMIEWIFLQAEDYVKRVPIRSYSGPNGGKCGPEQLRIRTLFTQGRCSKTLLVSSLKYCYFCCNLHYMSFYQSSKTIDQTIKEQKYKK